MRPPPTLDALLVVAVFSRHDGALRWARERLAQAFGVIGLAGEPYSFHHTSYYAKTMGPGLVKQLLAFRDLVPLDALAEKKRVAIRLEAELQSRREFPDERPVNIDPGVLTLGK